MPTISPACTLSEASTSAGAAMRIGDASRGRAPAARARPRAACGGSAPTARPTIRSASARGRRRRPDDPPTFSPPRSTTMRSAIASTSPSLCEMKMIASPFAARRRSTANRPSASCGVSTAVGSSRIEHAGVAVERLEDLDALLLADREARDLDVGSHVEPALGHDRVEPLARAATGRAERRQSGSVPSTMLSRTGEVLGEREMLVHHADAGLERAPRRAGRQRLQRAARRRRRARSSPRRPRSGRRGCSSAWSCRRRSRRAARGSRRAAASRSMASLATSAPKRLVMPSSESVDATELAARASARPRGESAGSASVVTATSSTSARRR